MRCFIHNEAEAVATCKRCGKAMCAKCSAYSGHSGVCPECRRLDFIQEVKRNNASIATHRKEKAWNVFYAVILCWTVIFLFVNIYRYKKHAKQIEALLTRNDTLNAEIDKLTKSLNDRGTDAFI